MAQEGQLAQYVDDQPFKTIPSTYTADLHGVRGDMAQEGKVAQYVDDQRRAPHRALALQVALPLVDGPGSE